MPPKRSVPKNKKKLTQYIRYTPHPQYKDSLWRPRPDDPYIYISFDAKQFHMVYGKALDSTKHFPNGFYSFQANIVQKIKSIIQIQWIDKAKVPIRFLPENEDTPGIKRKNVYWIGRGNSTHSEVVKKLGGRITTTPVRLNGEISAQYTPFPNWSLPNFEDPIVIHILLHESMHGLIEGKHFHDREPINKDMTCKDSLMCHPSHAGGGYFTQLTALDIEAAHEFGADWAKRNKKTAPTPTPTPVEPEKPSLLQKAADYLLSTGYFHKDPAGQVMSYWNRGNSSTLFQAAANNVPSTVDCLPMSTLPALLK